MIRNAKRRNPLRADPTRTATLRRKFLAEIRKRFREIRKAIYQLVAGDDAFGLEHKPFVFNVHQFAFLSNPQKVRQFTQWLRTQVYSRLRGRTEEQLWEEFIREGFEKGAGRSFDDVRQSQLRKERPELFTPQAQARMADFYAGTKDEFLRSSFGLPETKEKVQLLASRTFDDIIGVTRQMQDRIRQTLVEGLTRGENPRTIAREMVGQLDISERKAETIARTEIIRAHSEGQLQAMEQLGVEEIGVMVEWEITQDERLCPRCEQMKGVVLRIEEAKGLIPLHPNCRCAFIPANVGESDSGQVRGKSRIERAMGAADAFPARPISRERPVPIV